MIWTSEDIMESLGMIGSTGGYDSSPAKQARALTIKERLEFAVAQAEQQLKTAKRAKELFDKNPDLEELLNIMQRGHF